MAKARRGRKPVRRARDPDAGGGPREHWRADGAPKTAYSSADDANRYGLQALLEDGVQLEPYVCGICGHWHLGNRRD
jgi:hypothetical protein